MGLSGGNGAKARVERKKGIIACSGTETRLDLFLCVKKKIMLFPNFYKEYYVSLLCFQQLLYVLKLLPK